MCEGVKQTRYKVLYHLSSVSFFFCCSYPQVKILKRHVRTKETVSQFFFNLSISATKFLRLSLLPNQSPYSIRNWAIRSLVSPCFYLSFIIKLGMSVYVHRPFEDSSQLRCQRSFDSDITAFLRAVWPFSLLHSTARSFPSLEC